MAILNWYTDAAFKDIYNLSIVPGTHIIKSTVHLGLVGAYTSAQEVEAVWKPILKDPQEMPAALWHWSRAGFEEY